MSIDRIAEESRKLTNERTALLRSAVQRRTAAMTPGDNKMSVTDESERLLKWHMPTMLRWLAENIQSPRLPDGTLTGRFLYQVAENIEAFAVSKAETPTDDPCEHGHIDPFSLCNQCEANSIETSTAEGGLVDEIAAIVKATACTSVETSNGRATVGLNGFEAETVARAIVEASGLIVLQNRVRELEDSVVELWHESEAARKGLHEYLRMTWEEYQVWANPDARQSLNSFIREDERQCNRGAK